jgi:hypothetical protein
MPFSLLCGFTSMLTVSTKGVHIAGEKAVLSFGEHSPAKACVDQKRMVQVLRITCDAA